MSPNTEPPLLTGRARTFRLQLGGPLGTLVGVVAGAVGLVVALAFSLVLFVALVGAGLAFGGWFWWQTRGLRRELRTAQAQAQVRAQASREREVEGEAIVVREDAQQDSSR